MTSNNPELSNCCKAPIKDFPNMRDGQTVPVICSKCEKDCSVYVPYESVRRLPEQTEPEPTQELGWEEEFDGMELGDGLCPLCAGLASIGSDISENCQDCKTPTTREELKAFIRKVEKEAYERGKKETRSDALREAVEKLEGMKFKPTKDMLGDNADYYERGFVKSLHYAIETLESLLTNPKDK